MCVFAIIFLNHNHKLTVVIPSTSLCRSTITQIVSLKFFRRGSFPPEGLALPRNGVESSLGQITQSIFDTVALILTPVCARRQNSCGLVTLIAKQGLAYYMYVFHHTVLKYMANSSTCHKIEHGNIPRLDSYDYLCSSEFNHP